MSSIGVGQLADDCKSDMGGVFDHVHDILMLVPYHTHTIHLERGERRGERRDEGRSERWEGEEGGREKKDEEGRPERWKGLAKRGGWKGGEGRGGEIGEVGRRGGWKEEEEREKRDEGKVRQKRKKG